jgi:hypothetical protein
VKSDYTRGEGIDVRLQARISKIDRRRKYISFFLKVNISLRWELLTAITTTIFGLYNQFNAQFKHSFLTFKNIFCINVTGNLVVQALGYKPERGFETW